MKKYFFFILVIIFLFVGCNRVVKESTFDVGTRFSSASRPPKDREDPYSRPQHNLQPNKPFTGYFNIHNPSKKTRKYLIIALLDYTQIEFSLNDNKALFHLLTIKADEERWFPLKTIPIKKGFHDLSLITFIDPDNKSLENEFRHSTSYLLNSNRANLFVGSNVSPDLMISKPSYTRRIKETGTNSEIIVNEQKDGLDYLFKIKARPGKKIDYYIHLINTSNSTKTFAVTPLLDYRNVRLNEKGDYAFYSKIDAFKVQTFKASLIAPREKGLHELNVLTSEEPYSVIGETSQVMDNTYSSIRLPIVVN